MQLGLTPSQCTAVLLVQSPGAHRDLHSFPTRRSSDLRDPSTGAVSAEASGTAATVSVDPLQIGRVVTRAICSGRSEEHTSELQSLTNLVCRLLLEKQNTRQT